MYVCVYVYLFAVCAGKDTPWGGLTCDKLAEMAGIVERALNGSSSDRGEGWGLMYEKLTHGYWRKFVRQETVKAGGAHVQNHQVHLV